jgi:enamine deaminase RidA (YjgF/YER057c/UK114 family)
MASTHPKSDAPHPAQAQLHLAAAHCPEEHAQRLAAMGLSWTQLQQLIAFVRDHAAQFRDVWAMVTELLAIFKGETPAPPAE